MPWLLALVLPTLGCGRGETIELVALHGCGLDQEFSGLRVRVLGDFAAAGGTEILLGPAEQGSIPALPDDATGIAAEGLFGTAVTAIGRSYGIKSDPLRGRVPGFDEDASVLAVYFAAPDSLCELDEQPAARAGWAAAAGQAGDVLLAGGVDVEGALLDELVHLDLFTGEIDVLDGSLPEPRRGHSVHALDSDGGRRFLVIGGAQPQGVVDRCVIVDVAAPGGAASSSELLIDGELFARSEHASSSSPVDGRILLAGGCEAVDAQARCLPVSASASAAWLDPQALELGERLPDLQQPRYGAHASVGADGVAWVAGGFGADGLGLGSVERLRPGGEWSIVHSLPPGTAAIGLAVLDGPLVLLADADGTIHWWSEAGSGSLDPTSRAPPLDPIADPIADPLTTARPMLALPGERVLVDTWLFAPGTAAVDPAIERVSLSADPHAGAELVLLHDGTVLLAGGRLTATGELLTSPLSRLRPRLDGPDEWIPELDGPQTDAFVTNAPGRATVIVGGLRLDADGGDPDTLPSVRAHVRGFRSRALRLELDHEPTPGAVAHVLVGQGSETLVALALVEGALVVRRRSANGDVQTLDCDTTDADLAAKLVLEISDAGRQLRLDGPDGPIASCELDWPSSAGLSVGFGVSGTGSARFFGLRLARR